MPLIIFIIALIPLLAVAKVISKQIGVNTWKIVWYGAFLIIAAIAFVDGASVEQVSYIVLFPIIVHVACKIISFIYSWSLDVLTKD